MRMPEHGFRTFRATRADAAGYAAWGLPVWAMTAGGVPYLCGQPDQGAELPLKELAMPERLPPGGHYDVMEEGCAFHVAFRDGSNPYFFRGTPKECRKELRKWARNYKFTCRQPMVPEPGGILYLEASAR